jgi:hypothetical protein
MISTLLERYRELERELRYLRTVFGNDDPPGCDALLDEMESLWERLPAQERAVLNAEPPQTWPEDGAEELTDVAVWGDERAAPRKVA